MVTFLSKLFIKNRHQVTDSTVRKNYGILCGFVGIFLNSILFTGKFLAGSISGSIAITADAFNNLSDAGSSFITLIGFKMADQKPDPDHPFGHGRIEYLSGLAVAAAILLMAVELIKTSVQKIIKPTTILTSNMIIAILVFSILVKLYMFLYNKTISKKIDSAALKATAIDSLSDTVATSVVLICSLIARYTDLSIDGYCGVFVGIFICIAGFNAAKETLNPLLGQPPEPEFIQSIEDIVMAHSSIIGIHDVIVHDYGPGRVMISLHAEVPASSDLLELHDEIDLIEHELRNQLFCAAVIHMDPVCTDNEEISEKKHIIKQILHDIDPIISMHDFRMVKGSTHTNVIFDIVLPFRYHISDKDIVLLIQNKISEYNSSYFAVIDVDKDYNNKKPVL